MSRGSTITQMHVDSEVITLDDSVAIGGDLFGSVWETAKFAYGSLQVSWDSLDALTGEVKVQGSLDGVEWSDLIGLSALMDTATDSELFALTFIPCDYLRVSIVANSVTSGSFTTKVIGKDTKT